jgi:hypothetical protein
MPGHVLTVDRLGFCQYGDFWGFCSCGWTTGPTDHDAVQEHHEDHVRVLDYRRRRAWEVEEARRDPYTGAVSPW